MTLSHQGSMKLKSPGSQSIPDDNVEEDDGGDDAGLNVVLDAERQHHDDYEHKGQAIRDLS